MCTAQKIYLNNYYCAPLRRWSDRQTRHRSDQEVCWTKQSNIQVNFNSHFALPSRSTEAQNMWRRQITWQRAAGQVRYSEWRHIED